MPDLGMSRHDETNWSPLSESSPSPADRIALGLLAVDGPHCLLPPVVCCFGLLPHFQLLVALSLQWLKFANPVPAAVPVSGAFLCGIDTSDFASALKIHVNSSYLVDPAAHTNNISLIVPGWEFHTAHATLPEAVITPE
jgi:hypothetical protein